ncbi:MAG: triple tyrosine motif-containing protein [Salinimicrobium sp.]
MQRTLLLLILFLTGLGRAQELAPVMNFNPNEYQAGNQNWMISQGSDMNIYVANSMGLLEYTGAHWNLYPVPNNTIVRAVKVVDDLIFTGAYMEAGFWKKDAFGNLQYTSLLPLFPEKVHDGEQFWHIENIRETVVLQSFDDIYLYNLKTKKLSVLEIPSERPISNMYKVGNEIYFFIPEDGLFKITEGTATLEIPAGELDGSEIVLIHPTAEGLELISRAGNFYSRTETGLQKIYSQVSEKLSGISVFSALVLEDETFLLGSVEDGFYQVDRQGNILQHYNQEKGLQNNTILALYLDSEKNVWAGLDNGLSVMNLSSPFKLFQDNVGKIGTVYASLQNEDHLYLGTNQGLYFRRNGEEEFHFIEGTNGQVWSLQIVENNLFCGHNNGTFLVKGEEVEKISSRLGTWIVKNYKPLKNVFIQGHYNGFSFLRLGETGFEELPMVKEFPHSSKHIVSEENGQLWIGNEHKGVFRMRLNDSLNAIDEMENYPFSKSIGITSSIFELKDTLYYATKNRIFQYRKDENGFSENNRLNKLLKDLDLISGRFICQNNRIWGFAENAVFDISTSQLSRDYVLKKIYIPKKLRTIPQGYENISHLDAGNYLLGLVDGYLIFDENVGNDFSGGEVRIEGIVGSTLEDDTLNIPLEQEAEIGYESNNLRFSYGMPEYSKFLVPVYSYRLLGLSDRWSNWSSNSTATFKNLSYGSYTFELRGKAGDSSYSTASYSFEILRPYYLSNLAIAIYVLVFLALLYIVHQVYKMEHKKRIRENEKELRMKNLEAEREIIKLQNEQLEREMAGKNKELAASTMSLIKKNEFLTDLKEKLRNSGSSPQVKSVIKTIDKDISEEDNWKFFKKAFNNADKDFFKKIKASHPELTSNDLKLCAYLRLNLTSKEIAPLLNISVKSVEIKRYRLRKKMDLPHEKNLIEYILEV